MEASALGSDVGLSLIHLLGDTDSMLKDRNAQVRGARPLWGALIYVEGPEGPEAMSWWLHISNPSPPNTPATTLETPPTPFLDPPPDPTNPPTPPKPQTPNPKQLKGAIDGDRADGDGVALSLKDLCARRDKKGSKSSAAATDSGSASGDGEEAAAAAAEAAAFRTVAGALAAIISAPNSRLIGRPAGSGGGELPPDLASGGAGLGGGCAFL